MQEQCEKCRLSIDGKRVSFEDYNFHPDCFVTDTKEQVLVVRIGVVDNKRTPAASNYRRYRRVIDLVERVLVPLHAESTIETVRVK